jgi:hypothetical protein
MTASFRNSFKSAGREKTMTLSALKNGATRITALLALLAVFLFFLCAPQTTFAHAKLLRSEPKAKSSLPQPPKAVDLWLVARAK